MYFLHLMWLENEGKNWRNPNCCGFFSTKEKAEEYLMKNWSNIEECWSNFAVIEEVPEGGIYETCFTRNKNVWYYESKDREQLPKEVMQPKVLKCIGYFLY